MCRLHRDRFRIYGNPVPSSAKTRFMEMLNKKDLIWELMFYYKPQFLHIGHVHYNVLKNHMQHCHNCSIGTLNYDFLP